MSGDPTEPRPDHDVEDEVDPMPDLMINMLGMEKVIAEALAIVGLRNDQDTVERLSGKIVEGIYPNSKIAKSENEMRCRHALRLLLDDVDALVMRHGFSTAARDSMLSVKTAREALAN